MKVPQAPPIIEIQKLSRDELGKVIAISPLEDEYLHWDDLRFKAPPQELTNKLWWVALKLARRGSARDTPLVDRNGKPFTYNVTDTILQRLHRIDCGVGGIMPVPEPIVNKQTRDNYYIQSLIHEAITSSQLEGAVTTREVAKEMLRTKRAPRDVSERMILNNFQTMQYLTTIKDRVITPEGILEIHNRITENTLKPNASGRLRTDTERVVVEDNYGEVLHMPPPANLLKERMDRLCAFANAKDDQPFIHPVLRAIIVHFWLAYDHPFVDGNGRTARALFYWCMLRYGFWLFEFISISGVLVKAPIQYARAFLLTESDENDLTYFLLQQTDAIVRSIGELHRYISHKSEEMQKARERLQGLSRLNYRQQLLLNHALMHPGHEYTIQGHQSRHQLSYQTANTDLTELVVAGFLLKYKVGRAFHFHAIPNLNDQIARLENTAQASPNS